ncbi:sigma-70 family RNA polymerase sigma factor [Roseomonas sp. NAR14]|uniref:Sigma-70 family RNA polymerase sigma factor n=2 Tax=Roseomonas acroporae TaxID=2937791 RepID=A0A9X2BVA8_9PROT|nr:sigma-70 family RNA polymerase sigma factor [Roseomonas acroporae]MCK8786492.1 sigma-70 family RNA polymerase sigma factor [Roseomonas acroporae]
MDTLTAEQAAAPDFRRALAELLPELRAFARFLAGGRAEADDLVQDALLRGLASQAQFVPGTSLRAWTFTILRNTYYEQHRRRRRETARIQQGAPVEEAAEGAALTQQEAHADLRDLGRALRTLSPTLREALVLVGAQGLSYEEAATVCQVPAGTMKARVSRARAALAATLDPVKGKASR